MSKKDLEYLLEALNYGLNECDDKLKDKSTHYNLFANAVNLVENELTAYNEHCYYDGEGTCEGEIFFNYRFGEYLCETCSKVEDGISGEVLDHDFSVSDWS